MSEIEVKTFQNTTSKKGVIREPNKDFEVRSLNTMCVNQSVMVHPWWHNFQYMAVGIIFGLAFVKGEIISWFRIQEMFRLQSFHMYGVIGSAVVVGAVSVWLIKRLKIRTLYGESIVFTDKSFNKGQVIGGLLFGFGWALTGACPGPLFAQIGTGAFVVAVVLLSAVAGTWTYGYFRERLG
ncbi:MAG TPA: YeeE/YedE thiosulfate transporter family protein [Saprospiraceae bacterium]|nr:YeeE/YedE thiosulfate transporter family protein [Saprospiraceae bacterium]HNG89322.1 YeeE/YedE thiosulfate transporter family protein [Saprospiraceae bacterium]